MAEMLQNRLDDDLSFARIVAFAAAIIDAVRDMLELHAERRMLKTGRRKGDEPAVIVTFVGKRDQMLVLTAVVPAQHLARQPHKARIENALEQRRFLFVRRRRRRS